MYWQELVSFRHPHVRNPRLQDDYEGKCQMYLESPYDEMVAAHIGYNIIHKYILHSNLLVDRMNVYIYSYIFAYRCVGARERGDVLKAFNLQCIVLQYPPQCSPFLMNFTSQWCITNSPAASSRVSLNSYLFRSFLKSFQALKEDNW